MNHTRHRSEESKTQDEPLAYKTYAAVTMYAQLQSHDDAFQHLIHIVSKPQKNTMPREKKWISKYIGEINEDDCLMRAQMEVLAQEFFRLLLPWHPKTRCWLQDNNKVNILSEKIAGFSDFVDQAKASGQAMLEQKVFDARQDLAAVVVTALYLNEYDLRYRNLAFNKDGRIVKIDGGQCFAQFIPRKNNSRKYEWHGIATKDLVQILTPLSYTPRNWVELQSADKFHQDKDFQLAMFKIIYMIGLIPDSYFELLVRSYITDKILANHLINFLIVNRVDLVGKAFYQRGFIEYLASDVSKQDHLDFLAQLENFVTMGKNKIGNQVNALDVQVRERVKIIEREQVQATLLMYVMNQQLDNAKSVLKKHPDIQASINTLDNTHNNIIHHAVSQSPDMELIRLLCEVHNARLGMENKDKDTPLSLAARNMNFQVVSYFIDTAELLEQFNGDQIGHAISFLIYNKKYALVSALLAKRKDIVIQASTLQLAKEISPGSGLASTLHKECICQFSPIEQEITKRQKCSMESQKFFPMVRSGANDSLSSVAMSELVMPAVSTTRRKLTF